MEQALDAALSVFWQKGYEGSSIEDLTCATGIARPSLYLVFGNKEALFHKVLDRYDAKYRTFMSEALQKPSSVQVVQQILNGSAEVQTVDLAHPGCLETNSVLACSLDSERVRQELVRRRGLTEAALCRRLEQARSDGDLPESADPAALAGFVMAVMHGMAVQAKAGASRKMLDAIIKQALSTWPVAVDNG